MVKIYNGVVVYQNLGSVVIPDGVVDDLTVNNIATINTLNVTDTLGLTDVHLTTGTITTEAENDNDITNKAYVDAAVAGGGFDPTQPLTLSGSPTSLTVSNNTILNGDLTVSNNSLLNNLSVSNNTLLNNLTVNNNTILNEDLTINGNTDFYNDIVIHNNKINEEDRYNELNEGVYPTTPTGKLFFIDTKNILYKIGNNDLNLYAYKINNNYTLSKIETIQFRSASEINIDCCINDNDDLFVLSTVSLTKFNMTSRQSTTITLPTLEENHSLWKITIFKHLLYLFTISTTKTNINIYEFNYSTNSFGTVLKSLSYLNFVNCLGEYNNKNINDLYIGKQNADKIYSVFSNNDININYPQSVNISNVYKIIEDYIGNLYIILSDTDTHICKYTKDGNYEFYINENSNAIDACVDKNNNLYIIYDNEKTYFGKLEYNINTHTHTYINISISHSDYSFTSIINYKDTLIFGTNAMYIFLYRLNTGNIINYNSSTFNNNLSISNDDIIIGKNKVKLSGINGEINAGSVNILSGTISGTPTNNNDIVNKSYVDTSINNKTTFNSAITLSAGGTTITPTNNNDIVNKSYVDAAISGGSFDPSQTLNLTNTSLSLKTLGCIDTRMINIMDTSDPYPQYHAKIENSRIGFVDTNSNYIFKLGTIHDTINDTYDSEIDYNTSKLTISNNLTPKITINNNDILIGSGANQITLDTNASSTGYSIKVPGGVSINETGNNDGVFIDKWGGIYADEINLRDKGIVKTEIYNDTSFYEYFITNKKYVDSAYNYYQPFDNIKNNTLGYDNITIPAGQTRLSWTPKPFIFKTNTKNEYFSFFVLNNFRTYDNNYNLIVDIDIKNVLENNTPSITFNYPITADIININGVEYLIFTSDFCRNYYHSELYIYNITNQSFVRQVNFPLPPQEVGLRYIRLIKVYNNILFISENTNLDTIKYNYYIKLNSSNINTFVYSDLQQLSNNNEIIDFNFNEMFIEGDLNNSIYIYNVFKNKLLLYNDFTYNTTKTITQNSEIIDDAIKIGNVIYCRSGNKIYYNNVLKNEYATLLLTIEDTTNNDSIVLQNISNNLYISYTYSRDSHFDTKIKIIDDKKILYDFNPFSIYYNEEFKTYLYNLKDDIYNKITIEYLNSSYNTLYYNTEKKGIINYLNKSGLSTLKGCIKNDSICINTTGRNNNEVVNIDYIKKLVNKLCAANNLTNPFNYT